MKAHWKSKGDLRADTRFNPNAPREEQSAQREAIRKDKPSTTSPAPTRPTSPAKHAKRKAVVCYNCKEERHFARDCP